MIEGAVEYQVPQRAQEAGTMSLIELERQIEKCGAQIEKQRPAEEGAHGARPSRSAFGNRKYPETVRKKGTATRARIWVST